MSHLQEHQYKDSSKFNARIYLHHRFGTNKYPWPRWVFDRLRKEDNLRVLEIGCGNGLLWRLNADRIPGSWRITVSDFSEGMLNDARNNIGNSVSTIAYELVDVEDIPYQNAFYDIIIANHMLYHVPNRKKAISEIRRVLKRDGIFYATTMRDNYMREMGDLIREYRSKPHGGNKPNELIANFSIENGAEQLRKCFNEVRLEIYENSLLINEAEPFVKYVYSCNGINRGRSILDEGERDAFSEFVKDRIKRDNNIIIQSDFGLFTGANT